MKCYPDNEFELIFTANIDEGWYIYSQSLADDGPVPTEFTFQETNNYKLLGDVVEKKANEEYDPNFDMMLKFFKDKTTFKQRVSLEDMSQSVTIKGEIYYMTCDDKQCLPPELVEFSFDFNLDKDLKSNNSIIKKSKNSDSAASNFWILFFVAFLSGFAALLTPCVFPMIPMTVSFFTKKSKTKSEGILNAVIYGVSIMIIYVALGVGVSSIFGADALNNMATNVYFNIGFFYY